MIINKEDIFQLLKDISAQTRFAVLATEKNKKPYTSLVGYMFEDDFKSLYFFTSKNSEKYKNLSANTSLSLLIDNRNLYNNRPELVTAITVLGYADIVVKPGDNLVSRYLKRIPQLSQLLKSDFKMLIKVNVYKYLIVRSFQEVIELEM